jgi:hypothetical protein
MRDLEKLNLEKDDGVVGALKNHGFSIARCSQQRLLLNLSGARSERDRGNDYTTGAAR